MRFAESFAFDHIEPECGDFGQEDSFAREERREDDIEGREAVGRDEEECRLFEGFQWEGIDITDLACDFSGEVQVCALDCIGRGVARHGVVSSKGSNLVLGHCRLVSLMGDPARPGSANLVQ